MSLVTLQEARVRLEGDLEVLEDADARYRAILAATRGSEWKARINGMAPELEAAAAMERQVERALEHAERRSVADGWAKNAPAARFVDALRELRFELFDRLAHHNRHANEDLAAQLACCAAWGREERVAQARDESPDERWPASKAKGVLVGFGLLLPASGGFVFGPDGPIGQRIAGVGVLWLVAAILAVAYHSEIRIYAKERRIELWSGLGKKLDREWTFVAETGSVFGTRRLNNKSANSFTLYVIRSDALEHELKTFPTRGEAERARRRILELMNVTGVEDPTSESISAGSLSIVRVAERS